MLFFSRKHYLADQLEGFIDIHNHLLPNIDDGAKNIEATKEMIKGFKELGIAGVYTTPHTMEDYYGNDTKGIQQTFDSTKKALSSEDSDFLLGTASEYMMDGAFSDILSEGTYLTLPQKHLLFEFSYFQKPYGVEELIFEMQHLGLNPVLAHPERYRYLSVSEILDLKSRGSKLQLNLLSLAGHYGIEAQKKAEELLKGEHYVFAGTDAHKLEHLEKLKISKIKNVISECLSKLVQVHSNQI